MKIKFTITVSKETARGFRAEGYETANDVKDALVEAVRGADERRRGRGRRGRGGRR